MRVNARDDGIDAEWYVEIPDDGRPLPTPLVGPGWNVFQYKKRDLMARDRRRIISNLQSSLTGAVCKLVQNFGRCPNRYVLFVNVDLKGSDKTALKKSIVEGYDQAGLYVEIVGAAELAALLNTYPHLRAAYFAEQSLKTWEEAQRAHSQQKFVGADVDLIGREAELEHLQSLIDDPRVRGIVLSGPHDIGKSRLVLEATRHRPHDVVQALDPRSMALSDYRSLCADHGEVLCIVEDPEPDSVYSLVNEALSVANFKPIVTLPSPAHSLPPAYGRDERIQTIHLQPLTDIAARRLLETTGQPLDFAITDWIVRHSGGLPGVLLVAASVGNTLRHDVTDFVEAIGQAFESRVQAELGDDALKCARLFSVLTYVGIAGTVESELRHICEVFGEGWSPHIALDVLKNLERAGLARRGGSYAEITLPLLANYLVVRLLQGRQLEETIALFGRLDDTGRKRFIKRLSEIRGQEVERFWEAIFAPDGLLNDFQSALSHLPLLRLVAGTVPDRVLRLLETGLREGGREERLAIKGDQRRECMRALEQLLFRISTSRGAMKLVWLLAEAENESYGNNATGILAECFHPGHPQMPLLLEERLGLLREFSRESGSKEGKLVIINAIKHALSRETSFQIYQSMGYDPMGVRPVFTLHDVYNYRCNLVDLLIALAEETNGVAIEALKELPRLTAELGLGSRPYDAIDRFHKLVDWAMSGRPGLDIASLVNALCWMREVLSERLDKSAFPSDHKDEFRDYIAALDRLRIELETTSFATRLQRWTGREVYDEYADELMAQRCPQELTGLANEALKNPHLLDTSMFAWLLSPAAQRAPIFFFLLGQRDEPCIFRKCLETLGQRSDGREAFCAYWQGWAKRDQQAAKSRLDHLANTNTITGEAIILATARLGVDQATVDRVKGQIYAGRVDPEYVASELVYGQFMQELTETQFEALLRVVAGETFEHGVAALSMLLMWDHFARPLSGNVADFAWQCLEYSSSFTSPTDVWARKFDRLAARLTQDNPEPGFELLDRLLQKSGDKNRWEPLQTYGRSQFWKALYTKDRQRLLRLLLEAARIHVPARYHIPWYMRQRLDQRADRDLLLSFAADGLEYARIVASWLTSAKPGFWPLALELVCRYPHDEELLSHLTTGLEQQGTAIIGSFSAFYISLKQEIEQILQDPATPAEARAWLREIVDRLAGEIPRHIVWEYDLDIDGLSRHLQDKNSPQRLWAIGRVLK
jgi:hypothetical protein